MSQDLTVSKAETDSLVQSLQAKIRALMAEIFGIENMKRSQAEKVNKLKETLQQTHDLLLAEAQIEFPGQNIALFQLADHLPENHPLLLKYRAYEIEAANLAKNLSEEVFIMNTLNQAEAVKGSEILNVFGKYQSLHAIAAGKIDTESPQDFYSKLMLEQMLPASESGSMLANQSHVDGMSLVNTDARAYVTKFLAEGNVLPSTSKKRAVTWALVAGGLLLALL